ncbi:hypothetical protein BZARG_2644 [Bizionia argentinensis JUB59]|uniref:Peptidase M48 domain-containing protein n=1 Tax=Bizionia argentinensis JUB59 TaxID=1046627 RepID=G2EDA1_9FLAO|nr:M48 family metalloprotease [Bizionia argentinensis]EGV43616.2 hypothetical protein BZARG_2644 [Bizionia argentinensis JUB59]
MNKALLYFMVFFLIYSESFAQTSLTEKEQITTVFNKLVAAYGNSKTAPKLKITSSKQRKTPAVYYVSPVPTISVDKNLLLICNRFGEDSENALSIIIAHELAHYYNDHTFCTDFAFAVRKEESVFSSKLKALSKTEKLALETEADHKGLFYSCMAGYKPFDVYPQLLDAIYQFYDLADANNGYPTKNERKAINLQAQKKINELYTVFLEGVRANKKEDYDTAITSFEILNNYFPSRENYNNLGVIRTLKALKYHPLSRVAFKNPERFLYPLGIDTNSRLQQASRERSLNESTFRVMQDLLKRAQKDFEKAISLDDTYTQSYINLACVFDLLGNSMAAIGKINELPKEQQNSRAAQRILAIAYYNLEMEDKALGIWKNLKL